MSRRRGRAGQANEPVPWSIRIPAGLAAAFLLVPLFSLVVRAPWSRLPTLLAEPAVSAALRLSLVTATLATLVVVLLGVPLGWVLARSDAPGISLLRALVMLPLVLPPVVGGVVLLLALGRMGLIGRYLEAWWGLSLPFTTAGVIVAEAFVAMPFLVIAVEAAFRTADRGLEEAAQTLGAGRLTILRRVTLPLTAPSVIAGAVLAWARALGEFGATITFAGNLPGTTQTMPLAVYGAMESDPDAAMALSLVLVAVCVVVLVALRGTWFTAGARSPSPVVQP